MLEFFTVFTRKMQVRKTPLRTNEIAKEYRAHYEFINFLGLKLGILKSLYKNIGDIHNIFPGIAKLRFIFQKYPLHLLVSFLNFVINSPNSKAVLIKVQLTELVPQIKC